MDQTNLPNNPNETNQLNGSQNILKIFEKEQDSFSNNKSILSFEEFLIEIIKYPKQHLRNSAEYLIDAINYFGKTPKYPVSNENVAQKELNNFEDIIFRYNIFDGISKSKNDQVIGQESVQDELIKYLYNSKYSNKIDRLLLLHGPNGSAKSTMVQSLFSGLEAYSKTDEGAIYRFNWIFPNKSLKTGSLGFSAPSKKKYVSYAHLTNDDVQAKIKCEVRDHPLFLMNAEKRSVWLNENILNKSISKKHDANHKSIKDINDLSHTLLYGELSNKNKLIFDALMNAYQGDYLDVMAHIQVERFYFSKRYKEGLSSIEPQMNIDGYARQISADRTLSYLPKELTHLNLIEISGPLAEANRGVIEYNDLLKRPLESFKYLLTTTEQAKADIASISLYLDLVMLASTNDEQLAAFKKHPDWPAFKGRVSLIKVPYLLKFSDELAVYNNQFLYLFKNTHIAPFTFEVLARFCVISRLKANDPEKYANNIRGLIASITPEERLALIDSGELPKRFLAHEIKLLSSVIQNIISEHKDDDDYEGSFGASVREARMILLLAMQNKHYSYLSAFACIEEIIKLSSEESTYEFLRRPKVRSFSDMRKCANNLYDYLHENYQNIIFKSLDLTLESSHENLFERYLRHVSAYLKKEHVNDSNSKQNIKPDESFMKEIENTLISEKEKPDEFRNSLIAQVANYKISNPDKDIDFKILFRNYIEKMRLNFYSQKKSDIENILNIYLDFFKEDTQSDTQEEAQEPKESQPQKEQLFKNDLNKKIFNEITTLKDNLLKKGFSKASAYDAIAFIKSRGIRFQ